MGNGWITWRKIPMTREVTCWRLVRRGCEPRGTIEWTRSLWTIHGRATRDWVYAGRDVAPIPLPAACRPLEFGGRAGVGHDRVSVPGSVSWAKFSKSVFFVGPPPPNRFALAYRLTVLSAFWADIQAPCTFVNLYVTTCYGHCGIYFGTPKTSGKTAQKHPKNLGCLPGFHHVEGSKNARFPFAVSPRKTSLFWRCQGRFEPGKQGGFARRRGEVPVSLRTPIAI